MCRTQLGSSDSSIDRGRDHTPLSYSTLHRVNPFTSPAMNCEEEEDDPFPVDDLLFADTFFQENVYNLVGQELKIRQVFGANLGVAAPVWEAVRANYVYADHINIRLPIRFKFF